MTKMTCRSVLPPDAPDVITGKQTRDLLRTQVERSLRRAGVNGDVNFVEAELPDGSYQIDGFGEAE